VLEELDEDFDAALGAEGAGGAAAIHTDFQKAGGAENAERLAGAAIAIGRMDSWNFLSPDGDAELSVGDEDLRNHVGGNVCDEVAEIIDPQDDALHFSVGSARLGEGEADGIVDFLAETHGLLILGQPAGHRCEEVAAVKGIAHGAEEIVVGSDVADGKTFLRVEHHGEHAIVGSDEKMVIAGDEDGAPGGADSGIDNHHVNGLVREIFVGHADGERTVEDVAGQDVMADVDDLAFGEDFKNHSLHRAYQMVVGAVIGCERDDGWVQSCLVAAESHSACIHGTLANRVGFVKKWQSTCCAD